MKVFETTKEQEYIFNNPKLNEWYEENCDIVCLSLSWLAEERDIEVVFDKHYGFPLMEVDTFKEFIKDIKQEYMPHFDNFLKEFGIENGGKYFFDECYELVMIEDDVFVYLDNSYISLADDWAYPQGTKFTENYPIGASRVPNILKDIQGKLI